jgi:hypothetical protein
VENFKKNIYIYIYQHFPFQGPPKYAEIGSFGLKRNHLATPVQLWFGAVVPIKVSHHFAIGTAQVLIGALVIGTSLSTVGYLVGILQCVSKPYSINLKS